MQPRKPLIKTVLAGVLLLLFTFAASAQLALPTRIFGGSTSNINAIFDVSKQNTVSVQIRMQLHTNSVDGVQTLTFALSNDRLAWGLNKTVAVTPTSTNAVTVITNLPTWGCLWMKLTSWANGDSDTNAWATNMMVLPANKPGAP